MSKVERRARDIIYKHEGRTRYPSIIKTGCGRMLVLFTSQTPEQEARGEGDLVTVRRSQRGWWYKPEKVYEGKSAVPRAAGTMTALSDGSIMAPFAELSGSGSKSVIRNMRSEDSGSNWTVSRPAEQGGYVWAAPNGRPH